MVFAAGVNKLPEGRNLLNLSINLFSQLLNKAELSGLTGPDYPALQTLVSNALDHMEKAGTVYKKLVDAAKNTPYNPAILSFLQQFSYEKFRETRGLNPQIFSRVKAFLEKGDVTGLYVLLQGDMESITRQLKTLKDTLDVEHRFAPSSTTFIPLPFISINFTNTFNLSSAPISSILFFPAPSPNTSFNSLAFSPGIFIIPLIKSIKLFKVASPGKSSGLHIYIKS